MSPEEYGRLVTGLLERSGGYARSILRSSHDAEDACQQAALRGLERLPSYDDARPFAPWWFAILRNCSMDILRRRLREPAAGDPSPAAVPAPPAPPPVWEGLARAIERLSSEHAEILRLRYFGGLAYRELAEALSIPQGTVMSRLHAARVALARLMGKDGRR